LGTKPTPPVAPSQAVLDCTRDPIPPWRRGSTARLSRPPGCG